MFQLFQPIGGVSAIFSPTTRRKGRSARPDELVTCSWMVYSPAFATEPERRPVAGSNFTPPGSLSAENFKGLVPVTGMVNRIGCPGLTPKTFGPLMRGAGPGLGVRMVVSVWACDAKGRDRK